MKKLSALLIPITACICLAACSAGHNNYAPYPGDNMDAIAAPDGFLEADGGNYEYNSIVEKGFSDVSEAPSSYFSLDRNTASYSLVRRQLTEGYTVAADSVRIEELINYFDYDFAPPAEEAVAVSTYVADCPWNGDNKLMLVGLKTCEYNLGDVNGNYVFLIDVSGSMSGDDRLGLAKKGLNMLVDSLSDNDVLSIVTYASGVKTVLDGGECSAANKANVKKKINDLSARGSTFGSGGLERAYEIAQKHYITGGNNRVIIISDGDFNVGKSGTDEMKEFIQDKADSGVYLSVLGVGMGNTRDTMLETLANCGNGNYAYLDTVTEAEKVLVHELNGTLKTVAKDAKAGVTFTENVEKYRLIGYDSKLISADDFDNEKTDTGEIGSNLCVAALYEITLAEETDESAELATATVRYKDVRGTEEENKEITRTIYADEGACDDLTFIGCVAEFGLVLRNSQYKAQAKLANVLIRLEDLREYTAADAYKTEFVDLVRLAIDENYESNAVENRY